MAGGERGKTFSLYTKDTDFKITPVKKRRGYEVRVFIGRS